MRTLILTIVAASLAGCISIGEAERRATAFDKASAQKVCDTFAIITYDSKLDTQLTKEQIKTFNAKRKAYCADITTK